MNSDSIFQRYQSLLQFVDWRDDDRARVVAAAKLLAPAFGDLVDDFYNEIQRHPAAVKVITGGAEQVARLKETLHQWLDQLFGGQYDQAYVERRWRVGLRHTQIGLDQIFASAALSRLRNGLLCRLGDQWKGNSEELLLTIQSINKRLDLDLAIIENAYEAEHVRSEKEAERRRSEVTFRKLVETAGCMIVILRADHSIAYFSPYAEQLTGYSGHDVLDRDYFEIFLLDNEKAGVAEAVRAVLGGTPVRNYQNDVECRDGSRRTMLWNARRLDDYQNQPVCLAVGHDITSLHEAQAKALQSERLAAIGQMSMGLAHESRNALQRIQASSEVLELELEDNEDAMQMLRQIQAAQQHLNTLFDEVRGYAAPVILDRTEIPLSNLWREAWQLLEPRRRGREATIDERADSNVNCSVDPFRMVQVFRNLLENALAACEDPVEITITTAKTAIEAQPAVRISVRDNGPGIPDEHRKQVFSPFFTTKPKGTGLGMAIAQRIVEAHDGTLVVGDASGGTELILTLPQ